MPRASIWPTVPSVLTRCVDALEERDLEPDESGVDAVVEIVYADVDRRLWPAARSSVKAQLRYLRNQQTR